MVRHTPRLSQRRPDVTTRSRRQAGGATRAQAARQLDVFHQRLVGEAADVLEQRAPHEHGLVAGGDAGQPRALVHQAATTRSIARPAVDAHVEAAPAGAARAARRRCTSSAACGQARVGMQEQQHIGRGRARRRRSSAARGRARLVSTRSASGAASCRRAVAAAAVDDDDFGAARAQRRQRRAAWPRCRRLRPAPARRCSARVSRGARQGLAAGCHRVERAAAAAALAGGAAVAVVGHADRRPPAGRARSRSRRCGRGAAVQPRAQAEHLVEVAVVQIALPVDADECCGTSRVSRFSAR